MESPSLSKFPLQMKRNWAMVIQWVEAICFLAPCWAVFRFFSMKGVESQDEESVYRTLMQPELFAWTWSEICQIIPSTYPLSKPLTFTKGTNSPMWVWWPPSFPSFEPSSAGHIKNSCQVRSWNHGHAVGILFVVDPWTEIQNPDVDFGLQICQWFWWDNWVTSSSTSHHSFLQTIMLGIGKWWIIHRKS